MPVPNPEYKEDWEDIHRIHERQSKEIQGKIDTLVSQSENPDVLYDEITELQGERDGHLEISKRCLDTYQHRTIQDAAMWRFETFPPGINSDHRGSKVVHEIDFEKLQTMDDVSQAWIEADRISREVAKETALKGGPSFH